MDQPHKVSYCDHKGKIHADTLGDEHTAQIHARGYIAAGYTTVQIWDVYNNRAVEIRTKETT